MQQCIPRVGPILGVKRLTVNDSARSRLKVLKWKRFASFR